MREASSWSFWNAFSFLYSEKVETSVASAIATKIPRGSYHSGAPSLMIPTPPSTARTTLMSRATMSIFIIGSPRLPLSLSQKLSDACSVMLLSPYFCRDSSACLSVKPNCFINFPFLSKEITQRTSTPILRTADRHHGRSCGTPLRP